MTLILCESFYITVTSQQGCFISIALYSDIQITPQQRMWCYSNKVMGLISIECMN